MRVVLIVSVFAAVCGCSTAAPYQRLRKSDLDEIGYSDRRIAPDRYVVGFRANCHTTRRRAFEFAILRAGQIGVSEGYRYFTIDEKAEGRSVVHFGSTSYTAFAGGGRPLTVTKGEVTDGTACPDFTLLVHYFHERPDRGLDLFTSEDAVKGLSRKYGISVPTH